MFVKNTFQPLKVILCSGDIQTQVRKQAVPSFSYTKWGFIFSLYTKLKNTFIAIKCDLFTLKKSLNYTLVLSIEYSLVGTKIIVSLKKKAIAIFFGMFYKTFTKNTLLILTHSCLQHQINLVARASTFDNFSCLFLKIVGIGAFTRVPRGARLSSTSTIQLLSYLGIV